MVGLSLCGTATIVVALAQWQGLPALGVNLLLIAATAGLMSAFATRRDIRVLVAQIRERLRGGSLRKLDAPSKDSIPLVQAANDLVEQAQKSISDALLRAKELEIALKVATAERQHAEAIIYSISDAVLVTDPFDDLVLANESAARTFDFDLEQAQSRRVDQVLRDPKIVSMIREMRQSEGKGGRRVGE